MAASHGEVSMDVFFYVWLPYRYKSVLKSGLVVFTVDCFVYWIGWNRKVVVFKITGWCVSLRISRGEVGLRAVEAVCAVEVDRLRAGNAKRRSKWVRGVLQVMRVEYSMHSCDAITVYIQLWGFSAPGMTSSRFDLPDQSVIVVMCAMFRPHNS